MGETVVPGTRRSQLVWEGVLKWSAFTIICLQLGRSILMYSIPSSLSWILFKAERWIVLALIAAVLVYFLYAMVKAPQLLFRIKNFTKGLFRPEFTILVLFFVWSVICAIVEDGSQTTGFFRSLLDAFKGVVLLFIDDSNLFNTFVSVFIIFTMAYVFHGNSARKIMESFFHVICAGLTVFMIYVLYVVCNPGIDLPGSANISMSVVGRLGVYSNPNTTGAIAEIIFLMCIYMVITKKGLLRWLYAATALVHYFILILSNSRACILATGIAVAAIAGKLCFDALKNKVLWQRILIAVLATAAVGGVIIGMKKPVYAVYESISHFSAISGEYDATREVDVTFSFRTEIWIAAVKSVFQDAKHFFFGVTPYGIAKEMSIWTESHRTIYTHNQFLEIAVSHGVPGLIIYLVWLIMIAKSCVRIVSDGTKGSQKGLIVLVGMVLMLVLANLMEATLVYYGFFMEGIFFLFCGMVTYNAET